MIDDNADIQTLKEFFSQTPEEIEERKNRAWNEEWNALRMPEYLAREPEQPKPTQVAYGGGSDARETNGPARNRPPEKNAWENRDLAFLDVLASGESPDYDVLATPPGHKLRRIAKGTDGKPDYSRHPNSLVIVNGIRTTAAGRFQINKPTWDEISRSHKDVVDFDPINQNKAAWYLASDTYSKATGRDLGEDLADERRWPLIVEKLNGRWTSMPGGSQQQYDQEEFNRRMRDGIARYQGPDP